jgi:hypothetical protein
LVIGFAVALGATGNATAQGWGDVKGQVVWTGPAIPPAAKVNVDKDAAHCLMNGPLEDDILIIDPKTKGVKNVMVWLAPLPDEKMPIFPKLKAVPKDKVEIDQPRCMFIPRITMMREGQELVVKNPSTVSHSTILMGNEKVNGTVNLTIPAGNQYVFNGAKLLKAEWKPMGLGCAFHAWMKGKVGVFDLPYFAVTHNDGTFKIEKAPAGKFRIYVLHEDKGWLHKQTGAKLSDGEEITIPQGSTLDMGKIGVN